MKQDLIAIIDLGRDDNAELAREIRNLGVYSEVYPQETTIEQIKSRGILKGVIFNGSEKDLNDFQNHKSFVTVAPFTTRDAINSSSVLSSFIVNTCGASKTWNADNFIDDQVALIRKAVGKEKVLLALSGGVDSSVVAALLIKALGGENVICVHVNNGLMRKGESTAVIDVFSSYLKDNLIYIDATDRFLNKLVNVSDPETKRKIIGNEFIYIFDEVAKQHKDIKFLGQGTIYSDVIESGTKAGKAIKAHHNVGGLPEDMSFTLVEPIKYLFKDEVRACGKTLGLPDEMVFRQPFPGPGLGVRCLGAITRDRLESLREADAILREEFAKTGLSKKVWQYFIAIPDMKTVGVRNKSRSMGYVAIVRAVNTTDAMTATIEHIDYQILDRITQRIITEVPTINRVCYDLTPKPTGTIEWE